MRYTDAHTHRSPSPDTECILNSDSPVIPAEYEGAFSAGVHPMTATNAMIPAEYFSLFVSERCAAIGECGLDRRARLPLKEQRTLFEAHIEIAEQTGKPLIVHAVRTRDELLKAHREHPGHTPWILHGCRGNERRIRELADAGFLLSFGAGLLRDAGELEKFFHALPKDQLLMESDESDTPLSVLYSSAAGLARMNILDFQSLIADNFHRVFRNGR